MIDYTLPLDQLPDPLPIEPLSKPFDVTITPPGSKSITCRAYVLAALAEGESKIIRPLRADDTDHLLNALCTLGAEARWEGEDVFIKGVGGRFPRGGNLYMGEGGTPTRFMIACACLAAEPVVIDASPRMRERPIAEGVDMLRQLGAKIEYVEAEGRLPVAVAPTRRRFGGSINAATTVSSQFLSAILLVAPHAGCETAIAYSGPITSESYLTMTFRLLRDWGATIRMHSNSTDILAEHIITPSALHCQEFIVEPDASSAAYWWLAATLYNHSRAATPGLCYLSIQPDVQVFNALQLGNTDKDAAFVAVGLGKRLRISNSIELDRNPDGAMAIAIYAAAVNDHNRSEQVRAQRMLKIAKEGKQFAQMSPHELRQLANEMTHLPRTTRLTGLRTLRVKETDRIAALANELRKVGCTIKTGEDWIEITPPNQFERAHAGSDQREDPDRSGKGGRSGSSSPKSPSSKPFARRGSSDPASARTNNNEPIIIETYNDHRMAMAFAVLGLNPPNGVPLAIRNPKCVAKSYPGFWKDFAKLYQ